MAALTFDATQVAPQGDRSALPKGRYNVLIIASDLKPGKAPTDRQAQVTYKVLDGPLANRVFVKTLNVVHSNPLAAQIAQSEMSSLCHATGQLRITDTTQLHGRPFAVDIEPDSDGKYNEITAYYRADGSKVGAAGDAAGAPVGGVAQPPAWAQPQAALPPQPAPIPGLPAQPVPASAPVAPPAPVAAPQPPPVAAPVPVAPPVAEKMYYVAYQGQNITAQPIPASQVMQLPQGLANLQVCEVGGTAWAAGTTLQAAPVAAPGVPANMPPWLSTPPPQ